MIRSVLCLFILSISPCFGNTWSSPHTLGSGKSVHPNVSMNSKNQVVIVWEYSDPKNGSSSNVVIYAALFDGERWSNPEQISSSTGLNFSPQVRIDESGKAIVVWFNYDDSLIQGAIFNGKSWSSPKNLSPQGNNPISTQISMNKKGQAILVWEDSDSELVMAAYYNGKSWSAPLSPTEEQSSIPSAGIDEKGNAILVWTSTEDKSIQASYYNRKNWSSPTTISEGDTISPRQLEVAVNPSGQAIAIWNHEAGSPIQSAFYDGHAWSSPTYLTSQGYEVYELEVAIDNQGNAITLWEYSHFPNYLGVIQARVFGGSNWSETKNISPEGDACFTPKLSFNGEGKAFAIWSNSTQNAIQVRCFDQNWLAIVSFPSDDGSTSPVIDFTDVGSAIAAWEAPYETLEDLYEKSDRIEVSMREVTEEQVLPPASISGERRINRFAVQSDVYNVISWTPSPSDNVAFYRVLCDGFLLGEVPCTGPFQMEDHRRRKGSSYTYSAIAINQNGEESEPATVTIL